MEDNDRNDNHNDQQGDHADKTNRDVTRLLEQQAMDRVGRDYFQHKFSK